MPSFQKQVFVEPALPSLGAGVATGTCGLIVGGAAGILRSEHPVLFSSIAGAQCFTLGTSFFYCRSVLVAGFAHGHPTRRQEYLFSSAAGAASGALTGVLRSRSNIIPGAIMMSLFGLAGQSAVQSLPQLFRGGSEREPFLQRISRSRWIPLKTIPDDEYEAILDEKLIKIEAEIAILDEKISDLKANISRKR